jgi:hypothetical protein
MVPRSRKHPNGRLRAKRSSPYQFTCPSKASQTCCYVAQISNLRSSPPLVRERPREPEFSSASPHVAQTACLRARLPPLMWRRFPICVCKTRSPGPPREPQFPFPHVAQTILSASLLPSHLLLPPSSRPHFRIALFPFFRFHRTQQTQRPWSLRYWLIIRTQLFLCVPSQCIRKRIHAVR